MADFHPQPDVTRTPIDQRRRLLAGVARPQIAPPALDPTAGFDDSLDMTIPWNANNSALQSEMERLQASLAAKAAGSPALSGDPRDDEFPDIQSLRPNSALVDNPEFSAHEPVPARRDISRPTPLPGQLHAFSDLGVAPANDAELDRFRSENEELHRLLDDMKQIFEQASVQEQELQKALEELRSRDSERQGQMLDRDNRVQLLTAQIHELEKHITDVEAAAKATKPPPTEDELSKLADELEQEQAKLQRERKELDQDRQQLREDEDGMMKQMRDMEISMAKERADLARQRTELQRLHSEIKHELETLQRSDGALSSRLAQFQRRHHDVLNRGAAPAGPAAIATSNPAPGPRKSGVMKRIFGK